MQISLPWVVIIHMYHRYSPPPFFSSFLHSHTCTPLLSHVFFAFSLAATSSSTSAEVAHASVSGSAFMLALSDPKMIDRRLGSLYDTEDWADGPDGVAMSVFQREAFLKQLALITAPQQARLAVFTAVFLDFSRASNGVAPLARSVFLCCDTDTKPLALQAPPLV